VEQVLRNNYFEEFPDKPVIELCKQYFPELVEINRIMEVSNGNRMINH
jgi:hypothetical protein